MDITTLAGFAAAALMVVVGAATGQLPSVFLNFHGLFLVLGGTAAAMLINTPLDYLQDSLKALRMLFRGAARADAAAVIAPLVKAAQDMQARGVNALQDVDPAAGGGFVARAARVAMEFNNPEHVQQILENEIGHEFDRNSEIVNVFRTLSILAPMFGLVGTLIGIVDVLKHISNPEQVGSGMAVAITTAFYGIVMANLFAVPLAGKLRIRYWEEYRMKRLVVEGVTLMLQGAVPAVLERRLQSHLQAR